MALNISFTRPLVTTTQTINETVVAKAAVESGSAIRVPLVIETVDPPLATDAGATYTSASAVINTTETALYRVGDAVDSTGGDFAGAGNFPSGTVVVSKVDGVSVTVDQAATASGTGVDIDPPSIDVTIAMLEVSLNSTGSSLTMTPSFYTFDGSKAAEGVTVDTYDNLTAADATSVVSFAPQVLNLDDIYTAVRVPRT